MSPRRYLVTGGLGFLGAAVVRRLARAGHFVRVLDNASRGDATRLSDVRDSVEIVHGDVREFGVVYAAVRGVDSVLHFAYINGTEFFYTKPEEVLEVGVKGMVNVIDACRQQSVHELLLASSSEVYQTPPHIPTCEEVPLVVPDLLSPRYSYGGGKIISELMTIQFGKKYFERVIILRPHNVYGPDMGWEHVIPQLVTKLHTLGKRAGESEVSLPIQGDGSQSRAFLYVEDFAGGVMIVLEKGVHLGVYNIGTTEEVTIRCLAQRIADSLELRITLKPGPPPAGSPQRRCPDISRLAALGFQPQYQLNRGLPPTVDWYWKRLAAVER